MSRKKKAGPIPGWEDVDPMSGWEGLCFDWEPLELETEPLTADWEPLAIAANEDTENRQNRHPSACEDIEPQQCPKCDKCYTPARRGNSRKANKPNT
ncbi:MAG: hypothetical protein J5704_03320 [Paludibacteraceae bacterium]|jgi:hypothetical protein|nr:hypothetical protein [Paludibacteraceae bacterium]